MNQPDVAVIIPVFNRPDAITEAVASVLAQVDVALEIVVIDDGSTDRTQQVVRSLPKHDSRIAALRQPNCGQSAARNTGVAASTASLVTFLDSDDLMEPGRLQCQLDTWHSHADDRPIIIGQERVVVAEGVKPPPQIIQRIATGSTRYVMSALLDRNDFLAVNGFDAQLRLGEDLDFVARLRDSGCRVVEVDQVFITRRIHGDNLVFDPSAPEARFQMLRRKLSRSRDAGASAATDSTATKSDHD